MRKHFTLAALMLASALTACQDKTTEAKPAPERPVLVTARRLRAPHVPERSFVAHHPSAGRERSRLPRRRQGGAPAGQRRRPRSRPARRSPPSTKPTCGCSRSRRKRRSGPPRAALGAGRGGAEAHRDPAQRRLVDRRRASTGRRRRPRRRAAAWPAAERALSLAAQRPVLRDPRRRCRRRRHGDAGRARPGGDGRPGGDPPRADRREGGRHRRAGERRSRQVRDGRGHASRSGRDPDRRYAGAPARAVALRRSGDPHLSRPLRAARRRRRRRSSA